jgi:hypothetical protein
MTCGVCGGNQWSEVYMVVEGVGVGNTKTSGGRGIDHQNPDIERAGSISVGGYK